MNTKIRKNRELEKLYNGPEIVKEVKKKIKSLLISYEEKQHKNKDHWPHQTSNLEIIINNGNSYQNIKKHVEINLSIVFGLQIIPPRWKQVIPETREQQFRMFSVTRHFQKLLWSFWE